MKESFLKYLRYEKRVSPNTLLAYRSDLQQFEDFVSVTFPGEKIDSASFSIIRAWIINLVGLHQQPPSINRKIACLRTFYKFLRAQGGIEKDPMRRISMLKTKKKLPDFVREGEMLSLLDTGQFEDNFDGKRGQLILELFYATGIRLSELIQLKETQVDRKNCVLKVLGKRNKERIIPFPESIVSLIDQYCDVRNKSVEKLPHGLLFVTSKGGPCYPMMIYRIVKSYLGRTAVEKRSPHVLRHTYATHLLNKGAEINAVKDLLGHSSLAATQVYTHNSLEKLKKVFDQAHPKA
jgi:integrase/recombinase XerC